MAVLTLTDRGLYCPAGDFHIDPWRGVPRAVITHGHTDHARPGSRSYLAPPTGCLVLQARLGPRIQTQELPFGATLTMKGAKVSFHPAGHVLGSAQVRVEVNGEVWVVSGDYKTEPDCTCEPMEMIRCHTFLTESTFALPVYRWRPQVETFADINHWWRANQKQGRTSVVYAYSLGKAQRVLGNIDPDIGPLGVHPAVANFLPAYEAGGVRLPPVEILDETAAALLRGRGLVVTPGSSSHPSWWGHLGDAATAQVSGWMQLRAARRRGGARGFVLSDHADWPGLLDTIKATGAEHVGVAHGYVGVLVRYLREQGLDAWPLDGSQIGRARRSEAEAVTGN